MFLTSLFVNNSKIFCLHLSLKSRKQNKFMKFACQKQLHNLENIYNKLTKRQKESFISSVI